MKQVFEIVLAILLLFIMGLKSLKTGETLPHSLRCKSMVIRSCLIRMFLLATFAGWILLRGNQQAFDPFADYLLFYIVCELGNNPYD